MEFDEALQEVFTVRNRRFFDELEVEGFLTRKIYRNASTELVIKNKKFIDNSRQMYQGSFWGYANNGRNLKTFFISGSSGLANQDFAKDLARRINIINGKSINSIYTAPTAKRWKDDYWIQSIRHTRCDNLWWHRCNIIWFQEFLNVFDKDNITKFSSRYTNKAWVSHYAIITKVSKIRNWVERVA